MTSKTQLQNKIQELEAELNQFKQQLNDYKEHPTIQEANVGDVLEDGSIVVQKENGLALLVAPKSTEVLGRAWSKEFPEVFEKLKEQGFNPSQWFIPTAEQLELAYNNVKENFSAAAAGYWSSTEFNDTNACLVSYNNGTVYIDYKESTYCVRAFRCVTY